jgi:DNA-binding GntR family transcriptional regulator
MVTGRPTPWGVYAQIADVLRARIVDGELAPNSLMPSESALCEEFAVARATVRRALGVLEGEVLIEPLLGKGRVVRGDAPMR